MLAWVVMNRQHLPRAARGPANPFFLPPRFPFRVSPLPPIRKNHPFPFIHLRGTHFATLLFSNSYMEWRGCTPPRGIECLSPAPYPLLVPRKTEGSPFFSHSCALFRTFLHSRKSQLFSFQAIPHSLAKTPGVGEGGSLCAAREFL